MEATMKTMRFKKMFIYCICSVLIGATVLILARVTGWFGEWYASNIFPIFPDTIGRAMSIFPFSVFEILIYLTITSFVLYSGYLLTIAIVPKWRIHVKKAATRGSCVVLTIACTLFMMFALTAGVNYSRETFADLTDRQITQSSADDLLVLAELLIEELHELSEQIPLDEYGIFTIRYIDINRESRETMRRLGQEIPELSGFYPNPKPFLAPNVLSRLNLAGIYSPFTLEANYNRDMPDYQIPFTIVHEFAHLRGFMREDEANFIAYLACRGSESIEFRYSGTMNALVYVLNAYRRAATPEEYIQLRETIPAQVTTDIAAARAHWAQFAGRAAEVAVRANDIYLRANAQEGGVQSYGRMIDLLLAEYRIGAELI